MKLVVIGNGMAGARFVEDLLARDHQKHFSITMFGDEPGGNYNRILLSSLLAGTYKNESDIDLNPLDWYRENNIALHAGVRAAGIDRHTKIVYGEDGRAEAYDKLVIATGSRPFIPNIEGLNKAGVFSFRTLEDCRKIAEYARNGPKSAAVIGGGLLGLEAARGLQNFGLDVSVVHLGPALMQQQMDLPAAAILNKSLEKLKVNVLLNKSTSAILGSDRVLGLRFADGATLECDMVVISTGIRANWEIAAGCGLAVERGIIVDDQMRTGDPDIYAVGECAQHRGRMYGLVGPLWEQTKVLADHLSGKEAAYEGSKLATKLKVMGVEVASMGIIEPEEDEDEVIQFSEAKRGTYKKLIIRDGRLVGAILLGDISKAAYLMQAFDRGAPLPEERLRLLFDLGDPPKPVTFAEMSGDTQICNCNGVSKGQLIACVNSGNRTPKSVMASTRAGLGCGSCRVMVTEIVEWASSTESAVC